MSRARNLADLLDSNGDVVSGALDNVPPSNDASALTTGTLPNARLASGAAVANLGYTPVNKAGDTLTGNVTSSGKVTLTGGAAYPSNGDTPILELSSGYLHISHDEACIVFDAGQKMITSNDNDGNFNIKAGYNNDGILVSEGGAGGTAGPAQISLECDGAHGAVHIGAGPVGNHGDAASMTQALSVSKDGVFVSTPNGTYAGASFSSSSSTQLAKDDYPYGDYICKAWATYEQNGTHSFFDSKNFSSITDLAVGISRLTFSRSMPNNNYAVVMAENANGDSGSAGGASNPFDPRPGNTSYFDWDNRGYTNANYDKRWAAVVVYGTGA